jgi:hypothetical protein
MFESSSAPAAMPPGPKQLEVVVFVLALMILIPLFMFAFGSASESHAVLRADWQAGKEVPLEGLLLVPLLNLAAVVGLPALVISFIISLGRKR